MKEYNPIFDSLARLSMSFFKIVRGVGEHIKDVKDARLNRALREQNLVTREEFEVVKSMLTKIRQEQSAPESKKITVSSPSPVSSPKIKRKPTPKDKKTKA